MNGAPDTLVVGIGNGFRGDDAAGLLAARLLAPGAPDGTRVIEHNGDGMLLMSEWQRFRRVIVIDALHVAGTPGEILRFDASEKPLAIKGGHSSTHALSIGDTIELARTLGELPAQMIVYGIVGATFEIGAAPTVAVCEAVKVLAARVREELLDGGKI